jgi:hypothetical protein
MSAVTLWNVPLPPLALSFVTTYVLFFFPTPVEYCPGLIRVSMDVGKIACITIYIMVDDGCCVDYYVIILIDAKYIFFKLRRNLIISNKNSPIA